MTSDDDRQKIAQEIQELAAARARLEVDVEAVRKTDEYLKAVARFTFEDMKRFVAESRKDKPAGYWVISAILQMSQMRFRLPRPKLEHIALLVMTIEQADERLGDLDEKRAIIKGRHGVGYARLWYAWTGFWLIVAAAFGKFPGKRMLDALISKMTAKS